MVSFSFFLEALHYPDSSFSRPLLRTNLCTQYTEYSTQHSYVQISVGEQLHLVTLVVRQQTMSLHRQSVLCMGLIQPTRSHSISQAPEDLARVCMAAIALTLHP